MEPVIHHRAKAQPDTKPAYRDHCTNKHTATHVSAAFATGAPDDTFWIPIKGRVSVKIA